MKEQEVRKIVIEIMQYEYSGFENKGAVADLINMWVKKIMEVLKK